MPHRSSGLPEYDVMRPFNHEVRLPRQAAETAVRGHTAAQSLIKSGVGGFLSHSTSWGHNTLRDFPHRKETSPPTQPSVTAHAYSGTITFGNLGFGPSRQRLPAMDQERKVIALYCEVLARDDRVHISTGLQVLPTSPSFVFAIAHCQTSAVLDMRPVSRGDSALLFGRHLP
jgi:hypothetical protein